MATARWLMVALIVFASAAHAQDANITAPVPEIERMIGDDPFVVAAAETSRPKAKGDITLKAQVSFAGREPLTVKLRKAEPGADVFNNVPRYDLAAYELQKVYLDPTEFVVPPTTLRMVPLDEFRRFQTDVKPTFAGADEAVAVVQYWLHDIKVIADVLDPVAFDADPVYARHIGQLNILTYLIQHRDSNAGNFLIGKQASGARVFSIDHGVAFGSAESDRGELWKDLRVKKLPADAIARLRQVRREDLDARLGVLIEWKLEQGHFVRVPNGANPSPYRGVRRSGDVLQMGLTKPEIGDVYRQIQRLLATIDSGAITTF
jgi:hypothetical protein